MSQTSASTDVDMQSVTDADSNGNNMNENGTVSGNRRRAPRPCILCAYHGNTSVVTRKIVTYLEDAISNVHKEEICLQVSEELKNNQMDMTPDEVEIHINQHMINKQVIMSNIVHDLIDIARASKQSCLLTSEETGQSAVDPKQASIYFKAVDQLGAILRSEAFKANKSTA